MNGISQQGYLGKKHVFAFSMLGNIPIASGALNETNFALRNNSLVEKKDYFDFGFSLEYQYIYTKKGAFGVSLYAKEFSVTNNVAIVDSFYIPTYGELFSSSNRLISTGTRLVNFSIIPTLSFSSKGSVIGSGIFNELGIGFSYTKPVTRNYYYQLYNSTLPENFKELDLLEVNTKSVGFSALTFSYGVALQMPVTDDLHWKIGASSMLNFYFIPKEFYSDSPLDFIDYEEIFRKVKRENLINWNLKTGLVFLF